MLAYAELAVTTNFTFLRGASHPEELIAQAKQLGLAGIGIADRNSLAGIVRAHVAAKEANVRLAAGARLVFSDATPDILAYPRDRLAWARLTRLLTRGKRRAEKGQCVLCAQDLLDHADGLNLIVLPATRIDSDACAALLARLREAAAHACIAMRMRHRGDDARRLARLAACAAASRTPLVAVNDVLYHAPQRRPLQDVLTCIREHTTIDAAGRRLEANAERHLKSAQEMSRLFRAAPQAVAATSGFLDLCRFSLDELRYEYPDEAREGYPTPQHALAALVEEGARHRYPASVPRKVRHALDHELRLVAELNYAAYFLTVHDIVRFARARGILCQGRGSAANSAICYCLGITEVDPERADLLFERFVSAERREPPDIDVDFEHERREEVIQYIYQRYGRERAGLAATVICYRARSAIREVGKALGLSGDSLDALAGTLWGWSAEAVSDSEARRAGLDPTDRRLARILDLARELIGFPRHLSQHVGGFVITRGRLDDVVPIENAAMEERTVVEWDKDDLDALNILKIDVLGLGMLSCLRRGLDLLHAHYGIDLSLSAIPAEDPAVYRMLARADSIGVFQVESRAQMSMLPRLKPRTFYDLVIEVAIVRPGPIQGDMVHPYLRRRQGIERVHYPAPAPMHGPPDELEQVLGKTLGVPLFQEQAMRIAIVAAGFTPAQADRLRRAMATFRRVGTITYFRDKLIDGMTARGYPREFAQRCFQQIEGFGEYGFPESHAASFALLVYASAWIKCRYPDVFAAALLNSQPMGFYAPAQIVRDAQEHGVVVRPVDVGHSGWDNSLEPNATARQVHARHACMRDDMRATHAIRLGFRQIGGLREDDARMIEAKRGAGFDSIRDLWLRTRLSPAALERLAQADAFRSLGLDRRQALWVVRALRRTGDKDDLPLFATAAMPEREPEIALAPMRAGEHVVEDYRFLSLSLKAHPVSFLRGELDRHGILRHERLATVASGRRVSVAGLVLVRQRPGSANGVIFMTLEDETGIANTIVWPSVFETFRPIVLGARLIHIAGKLQSAHRVIHVVAERIEDFTPLLKKLAEANDCVEALAHCDEVRRPVADQRVSRHPGSTLARLAREEPALVHDIVPAAKIRAVMPKGRNFH
ncbi:MAG: error-prone DNA polymerase [Proteobacteria bacterium]|nr:error-prone DNA polymerase [Pseudomonadota bacterium]